MLTTNVLQRVFQLAYKDSTGTCFTIEVDNKQYIISAKHILSEIQNLDSVQIYHEGIWKELQVNLVGHCPDDVTVLAVDFQLSPTYRLEPTSGHIQFGQDVYFLGYPYGLRTDVGVINRNFPIPFIKKATLSSIQFIDEERSVLFLDGHNNPGFSGGPVVFAIPSGSNNYKVAGVISGYRYENEPVYQGEQRLPLEYRYNTGIIISYGIKQAVELIKNNPIGFPVVVDK